MTEADKVLYRSRFRTLSVANDADQLAPISFTFIRSTRPDALRPGAEDGDVTTSQDAHLCVRLHRPIYYLHTNAFFQAVVDQLLGFMQNNDLIGRARASTAGVKVSLSYDVAVSVVHRRSPTPRKVMIRTYTD